MFSTGAHFFDAWVEAASGPQGFWPNHVPTSHFRTASALGPELAEALLALLDRHPEVGRVVEVGAGDGLLLRALADAGARQGRALQLTGVDLRPRPVGLPPSVGWVQDRWDVRRSRWSGGAATALLAAPAGPTLLVAAEWLDDLPCRVAVRLPGLPAEPVLEMSAEGDARWPLDPASTSWVDTWWPSGHRVEVGLTRDLAWSSLVAGLSRSGGLALLVDYGHQRASRPSEGTLAGYRDGRQVAPVAEPERNLTAHVAVDAVEQAGREQGARTLLLARQREVLAELLPARPAPPARDEEVVARLAARSRRAALGSAHGWGDHWWLLQEVVPGGRLRRCDTLTGCTSRSGSWSGRWPRGCCRTPRRSRRPAPCCSTSAPTTRAAPGCWSCCCGPGTAGSPAPR